MGQQIGDGVRSFQCRAPGGREVTLLEIQEWIHVNDRSGTTRLPGKKSLRTAEGQTVNFVKKGQYEILQTGEWLVCGDPDAPGEASDEDDG